MHARDLRLLFLFAETVRAGSIRGAARALSLSPPVISTALKELEDVVGTTLVRRTTRSFALTEAGQDVFAAAERMHEEAAAALAATDAGPVRGQLRLTAPAELAITWLPALIAQYRRLYPDVAIGVEADDLPVAPGTPQIDLAVRARYRADPKEQPVEGTAARLPLALVCASAIAPPHGALSDRLAATGYLGATGTPIRWVSALGRDGVDRGCRPSPTIEARERLTLRALALQGLGAVLLIRETVADDLASGTLVHVDPDLDVGVIDILLLPTDPRPSRPVRAFQALVHDQSSNSPGPGVRGSRASSITVGRAGKVS